MEDPVFRLSGLIKTKDDRDDFEGPLTLILQLLSKNKIEIRDISITLILDQYLEYLDTMEKLDIEIASEFVSMASYLVYIKTKAILAGEEQIEELEELKTSLEDLAARAACERIRKVTGDFADMFTRGSGMLVKPPEYLAPKKEYRYVHEKGDLINALIDAVGREAAMRVDVSKLPIPKKMVYSVSMKAAELTDRLEKSGVMYFDDLFAVCGSRSEIIATFIAILELCKMGSVSLEDIGERLTVTRNHGHGAEIIIEEMN